MENLTVAIIEKLEDLIRSSMPFELIDNVNDGIQRVRVGSYIEKIMPPKSTETFHFNTLTSLVDFIKFNDETEGLNVCKYIHIESPSKVKLLTGVIGYDNERCCVADVNAMLPNQFEFGSKLSPEHFIVALQSKFVLDQEAGEIIKCCASIKIDNGQEIADDGISQQVTTQTGARLPSKKPLPNPVKLAPYRTFLEIMQPKSSFTLRLFTNELAFSLFESDGGAWKMDAIKNIKIWLENELSEKIKSGSLIVLA